VVSVLAIGSNVHGFKAGRRRWIFKSYEYKIRSTTFVGGEVKLSVQCRKILRHVKEPHSTKSHTSKQNSLPFLAKFLLLRLLGVSAGICQRALADKSGMIRTQTGT
jgi:hypothetical protein